MDVWRILRKDEGTFSPGYYGVRAFALKQMLDEILEFYKKNKFELKYMWVTQTKWETIQMGEYHQKGLNMHWYIVNIPYDEYLEKSKDNKDIISADMTSWGYDYRILEDGFQYYIKLTDGTVTKAILNEELGIFVTEDEEDILIEDVVSFRGG